MCILNIHQFMYEWWIEQAGIVDKLLFDQWLPAGGTVLVTTAWSCTDTLRIATKVSMMKYEKKVKNNQNLFGNPPAFVEATTDHFVPLSISPYGCILKILFRNPKNWFLNYFSFWENLYPTAWFNKKKSFKRTKRSKS